MKSLGWLATLLFAGCVSTPVAQKEGLPTGSKYQFDYALSNAAAIGLVRVFDDGASTYFQFRQAPPDAFMVSAQTKSGEAVIPHEPMGNYAVIRGVYRESGIASAVQPVVARKRGEIAPMADIGPVVLPTPVAKIAPPKPESTTVAVQERIATSRVITHTVRFARNRSRLGPKGKGDLQTLLAEACAASEVEIRVRAFYPQRQSSLRLAQARAQTLREALIGCGVAHTAIRIDTQAAAHAFVAEVTLRMPEKQAARPAPRRPALNEPNSANGVAASPLLATHYSRGAK